MLTKKYWDNRYIQGTTGWDAGAITTPIKTYVDQIENKNIAILIPGSGLSHEAEYIYKAGFNNVHVLDISSKAVEGFIHRFPRFPKANIHIEDLFKHEGSYDLIIEQTCFCALNPTLREEYLKKISNLLKPNGKYVGLLFDFKPLNDDGPPYGGDAVYYADLLEKYFKILKIERCYNSISPREGNELWISVTNNQN